MHLSPTLESGDPPHNTIGYDEEFLHYKVHEIVSNVLYLFFQILYNKDIRSQGYDLRKCSTLTLPLINSDGKHPPKYSKEFWKKICTFYTMYLFIHVTFDTSECIICT